MIGGRLLFGVAAGMFVLAGASGAGASGSCRWKLSATVPPRSESAFYGVAARAANDVWTVGEQGSTESGNEGRPLVEHWNGRRWRLVSTPAGAGSLSDVAATAPDDAWAVGDYRGRAVTEHWDGVSWRIVPSPNVGVSSLAGVAAEGPQNVWAVGWRGECCGGPPLIEHWDGNHWQVISTPAFAAKQALSAVSIAGDGEIWTNCLVSGNGGRLQVRVPPGISYAKCPILGGIAIDAHDPTDVWADVGVLARWDGSHWQRHPLYPDGVSVAGIAAISSRDVWVGGSQECCGGAYYDYLAHWNGDRWSTAKSVFPSDIDNGIIDIAAVSSHNLWAVGYGGGETARAEHYTCSY